MLPALRLPEKFATELIELAIALGETCPVAKVVLPDISIASLAAILMVPACPCPDVVLEMRPPSRILSKRVRNCDIPSITC